MAQINGSLLDRISLVRDGGAEVGVLLIDEQANFNATPELIEDQRFLLHMASRLGCRFWLIELDPTNGVAPTSPTLLRLRALVQAATVVKTRFNGFEGTNLHANLTAAGVTTHVVVLGHAANCCVKQTAIGGAYKPGQPFVAGAAGLGYTVMTANRLLSDGPANWTNAANVEFYSDL